LGVGIKPPSGIITQELKGAVTQSLVVSKTSPTVRLKIAPGIVRGG
jgi:hypothetical protein